MRAVVYPSPNQVTVSDVPVRKPGFGEAIVKIKSTTLCGSDLKILSGLFPGTKFPHIPGHEWSGEVIETGPGVVGIKPGERVGEEPHAGCGVCSRCLQGLYNLCLNYGKLETGHQHIGFTINGGIAEYCTCSVKALHKLPDSLSFDEGAFTESIGVALYVVERARVNPGDSVAIVGPGAIGLIALQIAKKAKGASKVVLIGTRDERLKLGSKLGADAIVNAKSSQDTVKDAKDILNNSGAGFDVVCEFAGTSDAAISSILLTRRGGRIALSGATSPGKRLDVDLSLVVRGHLDIFGALANPLGICERGLYLAERGLIDVKPLMSGNYTLDDFAKALDDFKNRVGGAYRVMIHP